MADPVVVPSPPPQPVGPPAPPALDFQSIAQFVQAMARSPFGFAETAYQDDSNNWRIGWNHLLPGPIPDVWTLDMANQQAEIDLLAAQAQVNAALGNTVPTLTQGQYLAIIIYVFLANPPNLLQTGLVQKILNGAYHLVPAELAAQVGVDPHFQGLGPAQVLLWLR